MERIPDDELIGAYLDDELSSEERARAERLLVERADLRRLLEELRALRDGLRSLPSYRLEEDFGTAVLRRAEKEMLREHPPTVIPPIVSPIGESEPVVAAAPVLAAAPLMPASVVASAESHAAREQGSSGTAAGHDDRFSRLRRPAIWAIVAVAAAVVLMFVPPRATDRHDEVALAPKSQAPEGVKRQAVEGEVARQSEVDRGASPSDRRRNESQSVPADAYPARSAGTAAARSGGAGFEAAKSKDATAGLSLGDTNPRDRALGDRTSGSATFADKAGERMGLNRNVAGGGGYGNQYALIADLDRMRCVDLVDGKAGVDDRVLIVEVYYRPGAIERAFVPSLAFNKVTEFSAPETGSAAPSQIAYTGALPAPAGPATAATTATAPATTAPIATAPTAGVPVASLPAAPQSKTELPAPAGEDVTGKAPAGDVAGASAAKKQESPEGEPTAELRKSLAADTDFYYVVAEDAQLEGLLNEIRSDSSNFVSVRVKPAPRIETQQKWNQYSRQTPGEASNAASAGAVTLSPAERKPASTYGGGTSGDLAGPSAAPAPKAVGSGAPSPSVTSSSPGRGNATDMKEKTASNEIKTNESATTGSAPGQPAMNAAVSPNLGGQSVSTPFGGAADSPAATINSPAAGTAPPLVGPSIDSYELSGLAVPQSRAQRVRQADLLVLRGLERGRGEVPAVTGKPLDGVADRRMLLENTGTNDREDLLRQGNVTSGGAAQGGSASRPGEPAGRPGMAPASAAPPAVAVAAPATPAAPSMVLPPPSAAPSKSDLPPTKPSRETVASGKAGQSPANGPSAPAAAPSASQTARATQPASGSSAPAASEAAPASPGENRPIALGAPGQPTAPAGGSPALYGALRSEATVNVDGQRAAGDLLRRSGGRQEALFIFRVARDGDVNSAFGDAVDVAKEQPASAVPASKPAAAEPAAPTPKPPIGKGG